MHSRNFTVLTETEEIQILLYHQCKHIGVFYNNLMFSYTYNSFFRFCRFLSEIDFDRDSVPFPDGSDRLMINTYLREIKFSFSEDELHTFRSAFEEAAVLLEVEHILNN